MFCMRFTLQCVVVICAGGAVAAVRPDKFNWANCRVLLRSALDSNLTLAILLRRLSVSKIGELIWLLWLCVALGFDEPRQLVWKELVIKFHGKFHCTFNARQFLLLLFCRISRNLYADGQNDASTKSNEQSVIYPKTNNFNRFWTHNTDSLTHTHMLLWHTICDAIIRMANRCYK